jgi:hypothetical protein
MSQIGGKIMYSKLRVSMIVSAIVVSLSAAGVVARASGILKPLSPSQPANKMNIRDMLMVNTRPPPFVAYVECPQGKIEAPDDRPVAMLGEKSAGFAESVSAFFPDLSNVPPDSEISWTIPSSIKYTSEQGIVLVTTTKPSPAAAARSLVLGEREVKLANGVTAWASESTQGEFPSRVIFIDGELLITVAGDLPIDDVQGYAAHVIVMHPQ